jgi:hypothetical protein
MYYKKYCLLLGLAALVSPVYADILVILPESGTMARASQSIKSGSRITIKKIAFKKFLSFEKQELSQQQNFCFLH